MYHSSWRDPQQEKQRKRKQRLRSILSSFEQIKLYWVVSSTNQIFRQTKKIIKKQIQENYEAQQQKAALTKYNNQITPYYYHNLQDKYNYLNNEKDKLENQINSAINQKDECLRRISKLEKEIQEFKQNTRKTKTQIEKFQKRCETKSQTLRFSLQKAVNESEHNITSFQNESENYESKNVDLRKKKKQLKAKLQQLETNYERNSDKKDIEKREETENLLSEMKTAEKQTDNVTTLQQTQKVLQKECSQAKVSIYRRVQMFPKFAESFETSAQTFTMCKEQIIKGVSRLNVALSTIKENEPKLINQNTNIAEKARIKNSKQEKVDDIKEKIAKVQAHIEQLKKNQKK